MKRKNFIELSIVAPMFNEEENVERTINLIQEEMKDFGKPWELLLINDGSTDKTWKKANDLTGENRPFLRVIGYDINRGRGHAMRLGFAKAFGKYVITIDFDLSYDPCHIRSLYIRLVSSLNADIVLGSAYMPGGCVSGVPWKKLIISKLGNKIIRLFSPVPIHTSTCILRGYRRQVLLSLPLNSDGKELHLEILSKANALGFKIEEVPAHLQSRQHGLTKSKFAKTGLSHFLFCLGERPVILFVWFGGILANLGIIGGIYITYLWFENMLTPNRPLISLVVLLVVSGIQILLNGLIALLIVQARKDRIILESRLNNLASIINKT